MSADNPRTNPYVGLRPFFADDSLYFFGREQQIAELLEILRQHRFLGVVGSSGSGKSSLVRAGLLPGLLGGFLVEDRDQWRTVQMKPGDAPIGNLAAGLLKAMSGEAATQEACADLEQRIREGHTEGVVAFLTPLLGDNANLFLLVDQFEEIFAFRGTQDDDAEKSLDVARRRERARRKAEAADFVDLLLALAQQRDLPIYVALTMRTDFLGDCDLFHGLPEALNRGRYLVPQMTREQLRDAVECPALLLGAQIASRLLDHVLNELGDRFDRLPVVQHALLRTWDAWQSAGGVGPIDLQHFESAGGLERALNQDAEGALQGLDEGLTARVFQRLTDTDASLRRVRSPARISELMAVAGADRGTIEGIVRRFEEDGRSFLHRSDDGKPDDPRVDISHESLIRQWDRLRNWVDDERLSRDQYKKLVERAQSGARLQDPELQRVLDWWDKATPTGAWARRYSADDGDFDSAERCLRESAAARDAAREQERQRAETERLNKERELEQAKALAESERRRAEDQAAASVRQRRFSRALGVSLLVAVMTVVYAFVAKNTADNALEAAESERDQRLSQQLIAEAGAEIEHGATQLAFLFGAAGIRPDSSRQAQENLRRVLRAQPNLRIFLSGHQDVVTSVAFSRDGRTLASGSFDGTVILWDVETAQPRGESLKGHESAVTTVAFSSNNILASGSVDGTVILWDVDSGRPRGEPLKRHKGEVTSLAFSPDGQKLASASVGEGASGRPAEREQGLAETLILWDVANLRGVPLEGHDGTVRSVAFSPDGRTLASAGQQDKTVILWVVATRTPRARVKHDSEFDPSGVAFSSDGRMFAASFSIGVVALGDVTTGRFLSLPPLPLEGGATSVAFSADDRLLATGSTDGTVAWWNLENIKEPRSLEALKGHAEYVMSVAFSSDGKTFASGGADGTVILWDVASAQPWSEPLRRHEDYVTSVAFSPDGTTLASASEDGTVILWDAKSRQPLGEPLKGHSNYVTSVAFSPDGRTLASASYDQTVILWDVATRRPRGKPLMGHADWVRSVAFSPDGQTLASASDDRTVILWDLATRQPRGEPLEAHTDYVRAVAFSPDGTTLASASEDGTVILWDVASRQPRGEPLMGHKNYVTSVAFSPDGRTLASGSEDRTVILWDVASRQPRGEPLKGHKDYVRSVAFSPDGQTLASASEDRTVILRDVQSRRALGEPLMGHQDYVTSVAFSPDGQMLASGSEDRTVILWSSTLWTVDLESWLQELCHKANRNLTKAEWADHMGTEPYRKPCTDLPDAPD